MPSSSSFLFRRHCHCSPALNRSPSPVPICSTIKKSLSGASHNSSPFYPHHASPVASSDERFRFQHVAGSDVKAGRKFVAASPEKSRSSKQVSKKKKGLLSEEVEEDNRVQNDDEDGDYEKDEEHEDLTLP